MRLIVTRPQAQAAAWVAELQALGCDAQALPLLRIAPLSDSAPLRAARQRVGNSDYALVMFVSANAVEQFAAAGPVSWPQGTRAGSTGPGTSAALRKAGVPETAVVEPAADSAKFDSEALWQRLQHEDWRGRRVLVVRGEEGRDWLAETLRERDAKVDFVAAYRRLPPAPDAAEQVLLAQALAAPRAHLWLFSSSEAVGHLRQLAPGADWSSALALASHPRIAEAARALGFGRVLLGPPSPAGVARAALDPSIQSAAL